MPRFEVCPKVEFAKLSFVVLGEGVSVSCDSDVIERNTLIIGDPIAVHEHRSDILARHGDARSISGEVRCCWRNVTSRAKLGYFRISHLSLALFDFIPEIFKCAFDECDVVIPINGMIRKHIDQRDCLNGGGLANVPQRNIGRDFLLRIPEDGDQRSEVMAITIPK